MSEAPRSEFLSGMTAVFDRDDLDKHDKLIALYLIRRGALWGKASVFQRTIAQETGVSLATVKRSLRRMEELGFLRVDGSVGQRSTYTLTPDANPAPTEPRVAQGEPGVDQSEPSEHGFAQLPQSEGVAHTDLRVAQGELGGSSGRATVPKETSKETVKETTKGTGSAAPRDPPTLGATSDDPVEALVRLYNIYDPATGSDFVRFTARRYQEMQAALQAGASYELVAQVIKELAATARGPWEVRKEAVKRAKGRKSGVPEGDAGSGATSDYADDPYLKGWVNRGVSIGS